MKKIHGFLMEKIGWYKKCHKYPLFPLVIWVSFIGLAFGAGFFVVKSSKIGFMSSDAAIGKKNLPNYQLAQANGMAVMGSNDFLIMKNESGKSGKKQTYEFMTPDGGTYSVESDKNIDLTFMKNSPDTVTYVKTSPDVSIHSQSEFVKPDPNAKIDPEIKNKLKSEREVSVIIQMNLSFAKFYDLKDKATVRSTKQTEFNFSKGKVSKLLGTNGKVGEDLKVINGLSATINFAALMNLEKDPLIKKVELEKQVRAVLDSSLDQIHAKDTWLMFDGNNQAITGSGKVIAILDTGVDYRHSDLGSGCFGPGCKVIGGYDFINNDPDPMDDNSHGTHVASTAAGNGVLKGVAPDAKILAYKVLSQGGSGATTGIIAAINRAIDPNQDGNPSDHADVISMSLGGFGNPDDSTSLAVDNATAAGVVSTIAAGNSGGTSTIGSPGTARTAVTVAASCKTSEIGQTSTCTTPIASFSSKGPLIWNGVDIKKPDVAAPGVNICAALYLASSSGSCIDSHHFRISGTSMATPHVAGAAVLVRQAFPNYTPAEVKQLLKNTAKNLGLSYDAQGAGEINLSAAIPNSTKVSFTPNTWEATSSPVSKFSQIKQTFSARTTEAEISTVSLIPNINVAGVSMSFSKQSLDLTGGGSDSFETTITVDNDLASSGQYTASILLSSSGATVGIIPVFLNITSTISFDPKEMDYGEDDPSLSNWKSEVKKINITNLRQDIAQNITVSAETINNVAFKSSLPEITLEPNATTAIDTWLEANNTIIPNGVYDSNKIIFSSGNNQARMNYKFAKYYVLTINLTRPAGSYNYPFSIIVHDRLNTNYVLGNAGDVPYQKLYLSNPGTYDAMLIYSSASSNEGRQYYKIPTIFKEGIAVNTHTSISVDLSEAKNNVAVTAIDHNGVLQHPEYLIQHYRYLPNTNVFEIWRSMRYMESDTSQNLYSNVSSNYKVDTFYPWPVQPTAEEEVYYVGFTGLQNDLTETHTAADFVKTDFQLDINKTSGSIQPVIWMCPVSLCLRHINTVSSPYLTPPPSKQTLYSLTPSDTFYIQESDASRLECPAPGTACPHYVHSPYFYPVTKARWINRSQYSTQPIPAEGNTVYTGLGPPVWSATIWQGNYGGTLKSNYINQNISPAFLTQDFAEFQYNSFPFSIYQSGNLIQSGTFSTFAPTGLSTTGPILPMLSAPYGPLEFRIDSFPYKIESQDFQAKVSMKYDRSKPDYSPPSFTKLYFFSADKRSEVYDSGQSNRIEFGFDPNVGQMDEAKIKAYYSLDSTNFTPIAITGTGGNLVANIPAVSAIGKIAFRLESSDTNGNSLAYTFELPATGQPAADTQAPTASITSPLQSALVSKTITVNATATDNVGVTKVELYKDSSLVASDAITPFSFSWDSMSVSDGPHSLVVKAYDAAGNKGNSDPVSIVVDNTAPSISLTSPTSGATVSGTVALAADASDANQISLVEFFDETAKSLGIDNSAPYSISWDSTTIANGTHSLYAKAADMAGNIKTSANISITVNNQIVARSKISLSPTVFGFSAVSGGATPQPQNLTITNTGNGTLNWSGATDQSWCHITPISGQVAAGLNATAQITVGSPSNIGTFSCITTVSDPNAENNPQTVTVMYTVSAPSDTTPPTVSITSPINGANLARRSTVAITATASDNTSVTAVEFYVNNSLTCKDTTAPYSCSWKVPSAGNKSYNLQAKAYDPANNIGASSIVKVNAK